MRRSSPLRVFLKKYPKRKKWILATILAAAGMMFFWMRYEFFYAHSKFVAADGGIYTESTVGTLKNLNPLAEDISQFDQDLHQLMYAGLLRYDPISGQITDGLANYQISEDFRTYTVTLRNSARFSNGQRVTIDDVIFTIEMIIKDPNYSHPILKDAFEYVTIDEIDPQTLAFTLPERNVFFPGFLTVPILPYHAFREKLESGELFFEEIVDPDYSFNKKPIGAGPYKIKNVVPNDDGSFRVFLEKNRYYYQGAPHINQLVFYVYPTEEALKTKSQETILYSRVPFQNTENFRNQLKTPEKYGIREYLLPRWMALFFHTDKPIMKNLFFRKALSNAVGKDKLLSKEKAWNRVNSYFFFDGIDENWHFTDFDLARRTLQDYGYVYKEPQEIRTLGKDSEKPLEIRMITSTNPPVYSRFAQNIAKTWQEELDINVKIDVLEPQEFQKAVQDQAYDVLLFGQNFTENYHSFSLWHSSEAGKLNLSYLTSEEVDFMIDEVRFSGSKSDLLALNDKLDELVPAVPLATPKYNLIISKELQGFNEHFGKLRSDADRFAGIQNWYLRQKRDWDWPEDKSKIWGMIKWVFGKDV